MGTGIFLGRRRIGGETLPIGQTWTLTSDGSWTVPYTGTYSLILFGGGGGGGGGAGAWYCGGGGGGGGGSSMQTYATTLTAGDTYTVSIGYYGYGGSGGAAGGDTDESTGDYGDNGRDGQSTSFGTLYSVAGGYGGKCGNPPDSWTSEGYGGLGGAGSGSQGKQGGSGGKGTPGKKGGAGGSGGSGAQTGYKYGCGGSGGKGGNGGNGTKTAGSKGSGGTAGAIIITLLGGQDEYKTVSYSQHDVSAPTGIYEFSEFGTGTSSTSPPSSNTFFVKSGGKIAFGWPSGYFSSTTTITENGTTIATLSNGSSLDYTVTKNLSIYTKYDYTKSTIAITTS